MSIVWVIILGIVQGVTEFFPVSSSGHLAVFPFIFNFKDPGLSFDIALHFGTFFAILFAFWSEWRTLFNKVIKLDKSGIKLAGLLLITAIPGAIAGILLEDYAKTVFRAPEIVAVALVIFGLILYFVDQKMISKKTIEDIQYKDAFVIGVSQALALVPGVSRSGVTITAARWLGIGRESAIKYSFMASLPIIAGASVVGLKDVPLNQLFSLNWVLGFTIALLASAWAIKFLTNYAKSHDFKIFLWWRIGLAALLLFLIWRRNG
jgi:undecaprenyl-diphosphatase